MSALGSPAARDRARRSSSARSKLGQPDTGSSRGLSSGSQDRRPRHRGRNEGNDGERTRSPASGGPERLPGRYAPGRSPRSPVRLRSTRLPVTGRGGKRIGGPTAPLPVGPPHDWTAAPGLWLTPIGRNYQELPDAAG